MATIVHVVDRALDGRRARQRRDRLGAPLRSHAAAHRPARAVRGVRSAVRRAHRELSSRRPPRRRSISHARCRRPRSRRPKTRPTNRLGRSAGHDSLCDAGGSRGPAAPEGAGPHRTAPADRDRGLRPVGVRRHARRAHRRDRHHCDRRIGEVPRRNPRSSSCAAAARSRRSAMARRAGRDDAASVGGTRGSGGGRRASARREQDAAAHDPRLCRSSSPCTRPRARRARQRVPAIAWSSSRRSTDGMPRA